MAASSSPRIQTFKSSAARAAFVCVKKGANDQTVAIASAATDKIIGVGQNVVAAIGSEFELSEVAINGGGAKIKLGGTVAVGDLVTSDASGFGVATTTANDRVVGVAMEDGVAGDVIGIEVALSNV